MVAGLAEIIRDLIIDIRCAERDGLPEHAAECRRTLASVWRRRQAVRLDRFGWIEPYYMPPDSGRQYL